MAHISVNQSISPGSAEFSAMRANHTDPEEQVGPIQEDKAVDRCRRRKSTYVLKARGLDFAIQDRPLEHLCSGHACEKL